MKEILLYCPIGDTREYINEISRGTGFKLCKITRFMNIVNLQEKEICGKDPWDGFDISNFVGKDNVVLSKYPSMYLDGIRQHQTIENMGNNLPAIPKTIFRLPTDIDIVREIIGNYKIHKEERIKIMPGLNIIF